MRFTRRHASVTLAAAAAFMVASVGPASAGSNSAHSYGIARGNCAHVSDGWFTHDGEIFHLDDTCADGFAAVIKVDIEPIQSGGGYDYALWSHLSADGGVETWNKSYAEGTAVCLQAGFGHEGGEWAGWGAWKCGTA
ncbi:hypothetical protein [Streptomyces sp. NPDC006638]|uniref:hypothetical protein n=1 Tax=unclassified Streptomyces TaxID=2593676 RepID=UPI0033A44C0B